MSVELKFLTKYVVSQLLISYPFSMSQVNYTDSPWVMTVSSATIQVLVVLNNQHL